MVDRAQLLAGFQAYEELRRRGDDDPLRQLVLFGKQPDFCECKAAIAAYFGANRCLAPGQRVLMADLSWCAIEEVRPGDRVVSIQLSECSRKRPRQVYSVDGQSFATVLHAGWSARKPCVKLHFRTGRALVCSEDHPILALAADRRRARWKAAGELRHREGIIRPSTVEPEKPAQSVLTRKTARLLGYLLGDGSFRQDCIRFTNRNPVIVEDFRACVPDGYHVRQCGDDYFVSVPNGKKHGNGLIRQLREWGLWGHAAHEKFVPPEIIQGPLNLARELIAGLLATDGCIQPGYADFYSTSKRLIDDLLILLWRLGIGCNVMNRRRVSLRHRPAYRLRVPQSDMAQLPKVPGKPWHASHHVRRPLLRFRTGLCEAEKVGTRDVYDLTIDSPSHAFIAEGVVVHNSGKSTALARIIASMARTGNLNPKPAQGGPGIWIYDRAVSIWVVGQTFPLLRESLIPLILDNGFVSPSQRHAPLIPASEVHFNKTESTGKLRNGSLITFKSAEAPAKVFAAATKDLICYDEPPPEDVWNECSIRIGTTTEQLKIRIAATLLPEEQGIEASWLFPKLVEPWQMGQRPDVEIFSASIYDNPHLDPQEVERMERQFPPGTPEHDIRILGKLVPGIAGIMAFPRFHAGIHMTEELGPWSVNQALPLCISCDFNIFPMVAEIGQQIGVGEDSEFQFLDEICFKPGTISDVGEEFRRRYPYHGAEVRIYGDASGQWSNQQTGVSNFAVLLDAFKGYPAPVRLCVPTKNPGIVERLNGFNRLLRDGHGRVRVRISAAHCPELEKDLKYVQRDPRTIVKKSTKPSDPYRERTHASEAASYWTAYEAPLPAYAALAQRRRIRNIPSPQYGFGQVQGRLLPTLSQRWQ